MISLVKQAQQGNHDAFVALMEQEKQTMYKITCCYLRNDEDRADAIQETILTCYEKLVTLKHEKYFKTWMIRILINKCNDILRQNQKKYQIDSIEEVQIAYTDEHTTEFWSVMNTMEEKYRIILILAYVEGFKIREIAKILELNENTVSSRLRRARNTFRNLYRLDE